MKCSCCLAPINEENPEALACEIVSGITAERLRIRICAACIRRTLIAHPELKGTRLVPLGRQR